jgi:hypothetical protein
MSLTASVIWVMIIFQKWISEFRKNETGAIFTNFLSSIVRNKFILIENDKNDKMLSFGFKFLNKRRVENRFNTDSIYYIHSGLGQASGLSRKDMKDCLLFISYDKNSKHFCTDDSYSGLCVIELETGEDEGNEFCSRFVDFLINNKVSINLPPSKLVGVKTAITEVTGDYCNAKIIVDDIEYKVQSLNGPLKTDEIVVVKRIMGTAILVKKE